MPRRTHTDEDWDDPEDFDAEDEDEDTISCPYCRRQIHEESVRCPYCEQYLSEEDAPANKPWWLIIGAGVCLAIAIMWIVKGY